jgi:amidase
VPDDDALIVARMKEAGAITLGKTNTPEFGAGSHTFNTLFGVTRNPRALDRSAGGSSGGAAAALASGMVCLADGSDLGGSLRNPASFCGVVGLRPSPGRVPSWPELNPWNTMATDGPMGRTVADVALFLSAIAGPDRRCPVSLEDDPGIFAGPLGPASVAGLRIAFSPRLGDLPVDPAVAAVVANAVHRLEAAGASVEPADPPLGGADEAFETFRALAMESSLGEVYDKTPELLKAAIRWNIEQGRRLIGRDVGRADRIRGEIFTGTGRFFERFDVLVTVVSQVPPFPVEWEYPTEVDGVSMSSYIEWMRSCSRITVTSCPALSIPAGTTPEGLPVGIQVVAPYRAERRLLEIGHAIETALG